MRPRNGAACQAREITIKFLGSFTYQVDGKGRVSLPAAFRRAAPDRGFVLVQAYPPALSLYPEESWVEVEERLRDVLRRQPDARPYVLSLMAKAVEVAPDAQGRILIPSHLKEAAELDGSALLVGAIDRIEVWNPAHFEAAVDEKAGEFEDLAPQIFR